jgi:tetratricopeptide (TPR) repeat protein
MEQWLKIAPLVALGFALAGPAIRAQDQEALPPPEKVDNWKYVNPGPAKCVAVGNYYLRRGKLKAALSRFEEAAKTDPHYAPAYLGLGKVYERMGLKQKALEAYQQYLDELPSAKEAQEAKDVQEAVARLQKQVKPASQPTKQSLPH